MTGESRADQDWRPVAIVTGAAGGIGQEVVRRLEADGYSVCGVDLAPSKSAMALRADVTDEVAVRRAVELVERELGPPAVLVTAAGKYDEAYLCDITPDAWSAMLRLHLGGTVASCRAVVPGMVKRGRGFVICVGSELALGGAENAAHYAAAKGAIVGFAKALALEVAATGVTVNVVAPGPTDTPMIPTGSPWRSDSYLRSVPIGRLVTPEEVASAVAFLIDEGHFYTGQVLSPNGGVVI